MGKKTFEEGVTDSGEEETDYNQHYPLVSGKEADNIGDITYESPAGSENGKGSDIEAKTAELMPYASLPFVRREGRGRGALTNPQHWEGGMAGVRFTDKWVYETYTFNIIMWQDTCEPICFKVGMMLNTAKLYSLNGLELQES